MSTEMHDDEPSAAATKSLEVATALFFLVIGVVVMWDSYRIGSDWGSDGPQSGYFPFYIGLFMIISTVANLLSALRKRRNTSFVSKAKLKLVMGIFLPCLVYLVVMQFVGLYVSSAIFIAIFMHWQGKFGWFKSILTGVGVNVILFAMFEIWFQVPLFKGPLEAAFGY